MNIKRTNQDGNVVIGILIIGAIFFGVSSLFGGSDDDYGNDSSPSYYSESSTYSSEYNDYSEYDYDEEEYPVGFSGTETMEACNNDTGNCYNLDIDSDGENVERINFPNGGWRDVDYSDCGGGYCIVEDEDGTEWELQY